VSSLAMKGLWLFNRCDVCSAKW